MNQQYFAGCVVIGNLTNAGFKSEPGTLLKAAPGFFIVLLSLLKLKKSFHIINYRTIDIMYINQQTGLISKCSICKSHSIQFIEYFPLTKQNWFRCTICGHTWGEVVIQFNMNIKK